MLGNLTSEQLEAYAVYHSILDLSKQIDSGKFDYDPDPAVEPQYDSTGRLVNGPHDRQLKSALLERTALVQKAVEIIPNYTPPENFLPVHKTTEKIYLPVAEHPHLNFVGLLLGPRGRTLQRIERESGARISIRGRGSSKTATHDREDLHCIVSSENPMALEKAKKAVSDVVDAAVNNPENENEFKRNQLRELATLNGTLRQELCSLCGSPDHRRADCVQKIICRSCQGEGHFARDCKEKRAAEDLFENLFDDVKRQRKDNKPGEVLAAVAPSNDSALPPGLASAGPPGGPPGIEPPGLPTVKPPGVPTEPPAGISTAIAPPPGLSNAPPAPLAAPQVPPPPVVPGVPSGAPPPLQGLPPGPPPSGPPPVVAPPPPAERPAPPAPPAPTL